MNAESSKQPRATRRVRKWLATATLLALGGVSGGLVAGAMTAQAHGTCVACSVTAMATTPWSAHGIGLRIPRPGWLVPWMPMTNRKPRPVEQRTVDAVFPLVEQHRDNRQELIEMLARPQLDNEALEALRQSELRLIDEASQQLTGALTKVSQVLTPEQRQELLAMAARMRGRHR